MGFGTSHGAELAIRQHMMREAHRKATDNAEPGDARAMRNLKLTTTVSPIALGTANVAIK